MAPSLLSPFSSSFSSAIPASVAALPFLFVRDTGDDEAWKVRAALATAAAAEQADDRRRNSRSRLAYLLCELGFQLGRRGGDRDADLPLPRQELARTIGLPLPKVKRILALLTLSNVISADGDRMRIIDWKRLCGVAQYDPARLNVVEPDDWATLLADEEICEQPSTEPPQSSLVTASGDPACFV